MRGWEERNVEESNWKMLKKGKVLTTFLKKKTKTNAGRATTSEEKTQT